jgi:hypothetical protein
MELIPILSTIILIATISTFLLAIGAYVLYKTRERRGQVSVAPRQAELRAEIVSPAGVSAQQQTEQPRQIHQPVYSEHQPVIIQQQAPAQQQRLAQRPQAFTAYGQQPGNPNVQQPGQYDKTGYVQQRGYQAPQQGAQQGDGKTKKDSKFLKYTAEGYVVPSKENKDSGAARWR